MEISLMREGQEQHAEGQAPKVGATTALCLWDWVNGLTTGIVSRTDQQHQQHQHQHVLGAC